MAGEKKNRAHTLCIKPETVAGEKHTAGLKALSWHRCSGPELSVVFMVGLHRGPPNWSATPEVSGTWDQRSVLCSKPSDSLISQLNYHFPEKVPPGHPESTTRSVASWCLPDLLQHPPPHHLLSLPPESRQGDKRLRRQCIRCRPLLSEFFTDSIKG